MPAKAPLAEADVRAVLAELELLRRRTGGRPPADVKAAVLALEAHADELATPAIAPDEVAAQTRTVEVPGKPPLVDTSNAIGLDTVEVLGVELTEDGENIGKALVAILGGELTHKEGRGRVSYLLGGDAAAGLVVEVLKGALNVDPLLAERLVAKMRQAVPRLFIAKA